MQPLWHRRFLQAFTKSVCYSNQWVTYFTPRPVISTFRQSGFKLVARDFRRCADTFKPPKFSFVPYFLYCRAIELGLKAIHLETERQQEVKEEYGHDLIRSYKALPPERRTLSTADSDLLAQISRLYERKAFEYVQPGDAAHGYSDFPDLEQLARLATNFASE